MSSSNSLCSICQGINFKPWRDLTEKEKRIIFSCNDDYDDDEDDLEDYEDYSGEPYDEYKLKYIHHPDFLTLKKSADKGCQFCYQLCYGAFKGGLFEKSNENYSEAIYLELDVHQLTPSVNEQEYKGALMVKYGGGLWGHMRLRKKTDDFENHAQRKELSNDEMTTGSTINLKLAAEWLHKCITCHACASSQHRGQVKLPLRVLDLGPCKNSETIRLSEGLPGEDRMGSYATLSYCWGNATPPPKHRTTDVTIDAHKLQIDASILPQTFTDAIFICRQLGIRFLWIDSMCIIQENEKDWKEQSTQMANIYANATLNISAANGMSSEASLFVNRDPRKTYPCPINCRYIDKKGSFVDTSFLSCVDIDSEMFGHLDTRGWTFQEMYLPLRTLRFSATGMYWICAEQNASESMTAGLRPFNNKSDFDNLIGRGIAKSVFDGKDISKKYDWWYRAVEKYSRRNLTRESDRLIALSGLASLFGEGLEDEYVAGLWKADIVRGLAWTVATKQKTRLTESDLIEPLSSALPSWSWASRPGKSIIYEKKFEHVPDLEYSSATTSNSKPQSCPMFDLLSLDCTPEDSQPSTPSTNGCLRIRALILRAAQKEGSPDFIDVFRPYGHTCYIYWGTAKYDEPIQREDTLYCLPISFDLDSSASEQDIRLVMEEHNVTTTDELLSSQRSWLETGMVFPDMTWCGNDVPNMMLKGKGQFICLLLKKAGTEGMKFRRVGYAEIIDGQCFEEVVPEIIEII